MGLVGTFLARRPAPVVRIQAHRNYGAEAKEPTKKILICAPSNAAIDEVAHRLKQGIKTAAGAIFIPKIVRVGNEDKISPLVKDLSLEELVGTLVNNNPEKMTDLSVLRTRLQTITKKIGENLEATKQENLGSIRASELGEELGKLRSERRGLVSQLDATKDENETIRRNRDSNRRKFEAQVLQDADVICATLSGSGHNSLTPFTFETVVIDEAAQSVELSSLIPFKYGATQAILVGGVFGSN